MDFSFFEAAKSRFVAAFMLLIACLNPIEVLAMKCQNTGMVCTDSTPCKTISGVMVCLSTVKPLPAGALPSSQPCWASTGTYQCLDAAAPMTDTCATLAADSTCGKTNATCTLTDAMSGQCISYTDTYSCQTGGGVTTTQTDCSGQTFCSDGTCFTKKDKPNDALAKAVTGMEVARQAGFYMDPKTMTVFGGEGSWCSQNNLGLANCCKPDPKGASFANSIIVDELVKNGWNAWAKDVMGSSYTFDSLFNQASGFMDRAVAGMELVSNGHIIDAGRALIGLQPANFVGPMPPPPAGVISMPAGGAMGGTVGGMVGQFLASSIAPSLSNSKGVQGSIAAAGFVAGTIGGTYVGAGAYALVSSVGSGVTAVATGTAGVGTAFSGTASAFTMAGSKAFSAICVPCLTAVAVVMIIQAFLACDVPEIKTQMKLGAPGLCHHVGSYCSAEIPVIGGCITTRQQYCCFNSKLARLIQEQGRTQVGKGWGTPQAPDCSGFTTEQLGKLDFSKIDLSSFQADVVAAVNPTAGQLAASATAKVNAFFGNASSPTLTHGVIPGSTPGVPQPINLTTIDPAPTPVMPACNTVLTKTAIASNGDQSGSTLINSCLTNGVAAFVYTGDCATLQTSTVFDVALDANGAGVFSTVVPAACKTSNNLWTARIIDPVSGNMPGKINVMW